MNTLRRSGAFTIVELAIVIAVIGILAAAVLVAYPLALNNAKDAKVREGAAKIVSATTEWATRSNISASSIAWGAGSSGAAVVNSDGVAQCNGSSASAGYSWVSAGKHSCTLEDILVKSQYLPPSYIESLPQNPRTKAAKETYRIARCTNQPKNFVLLYSMSSPTPEDDSEYSRIVTLCNIQSSEKSTLGMNGATLIEIEG